MFDPRLTVLLCEDNEDDAFLTLRIFQKLQIPNPVMRVCDGAEAVEYLSGAGKYADRKKYPFPGAIITDIKMPKADGFHVLQWFRDHRDRSIIPIVVWSSSLLPNDIKTAYNLGAHCFLPKSTEMAKWENSIRALFQFWEFCEFPPE